MRAMVFSRFGPAHEMTLQDVQTPEPRADEVLIKLSHAAVNPIDWKIRAGELAGFHPTTFPAVVGYDGAGIVERVGPGVTEFKPGDRVLTCGCRDPGAWGTYAEFVRVPGRYVAPMPRSLTFAEAASVPIASLTSFQSLFYEDKGDLIPGQRVVIHGASGGVGSFAVAYAKAGGLLVAATCSAKNMDYVRALGADLVIDYRAPNMGGAVRAWAPDGVDVVMDGVGPATILDALDMLKPGGKLVSIITVTHDGDVEKDTELAADRGFQKICTAIDFERARDSFREMGNLIDAPRFRMPSLEILNLEDAAMAHAVSETGHVRGKIVLKVADL